MSEIPVRLGGALLLYLSGKLDEMSYSSNDPSLGVFLSRVSFLIGALMVLLS